MRASNRHEAWVRGGAGGMGAQWVGGREEMGWVAWKEMGRPSSLRSRSPKYLSRTKSSIAYPPPQISFVRSPDGSSWPVLLADGGPGQIFTTKAVSAHDTCHAHRHAHSSFARPS